MTVNAARTVNAALQSRLQLHLLVCCHEYIQDVWECLGGVFLLK